MATGDGEWEVDAPDLYRAKQWAQARRISAADFVPLSGTPTVPYATPRPPGESIADSSPVASVVVVVVTLLFAGVLVVAMIPGMATEAVSAVARLAWVAAAVGIIAAGVYWGLRASRGGTAPVPVVTTADAGPGRYRVVGVDRATKLDTTWHVEADSVANARVKAELEGIVVTGIERVDAETARA